MLTPSARVDAIERAHATLGLPYAKIARILLTGESTLYRWRAGASTPMGVNRARPAMLDEFLNALERGFPDVAATRRWLDAPFALLGGRPPRALLSKGRAELLVGVLAVLSALPATALNALASAPTTPPTGAMADRPSCGVPAAAVLPLPGAWSAREPALRAVPREG